MAWKKTNGRESVPIAEFSLNGLYLVWWPCHCRVCAPWLSACTSWTWWSCFPSLYFLRDEQKYQLGVVWCMHFAYMFTPLCNNATFYRDILRWCHILHTCLCHVLCIMGTKRALKYISSYNNEDWKP
jgi:hypothetical protein